MDLEDAFSALTPEQQKVIAAVYLEGRTYAEAAEALGMPMGTLKHHQTDGLAVLRRQMGFGSGGSREERP